MNCNNRNKIRAQTFGCGFLGEDVHLSRSANTVQRTDVPRRFVNSGILYIHIYNWIYVQRERERERGEMPGRS